MMVLLHKWLANHEDLDALVVITDHVLSHDYGISLQMGVVGHEREE
jgi:hypothetical protein